MNQRSRRLGILNVDRLQFATTNLVVNGSTATVVKISESAEFVGKGSRLSIEADIGNWRATFDPMRLADAQGRPRPGWPTLRRSTAPKA